MDQPVGTGLSYADTSFSQPFVKSMDGNLFILPD
jgi:carboxypeptidase C (cathepsin A)